MFDKQRWAREYAKWNNKELESIRKRLSGEVAAYQEAVIQMEWLRDCASMRIDVLENEIRLRAERK